MRLLVALNVDSWPDRIVRRAEREQRLQVTQWGRWAPVTPDVTYIGDIWRESKLGCLLQFGSIHLPWPSLYNSELLERD